MWAHFLLLLLLLSSPTLRGAGSEVAQLMARCLWASHDIDRDDLGDFHSRLTTSPLLESPPGSPPNPKLAALKAGLEKGEFHDVMEFANLLDAAMQERGWPEPLRLAVLSMNPRAASQMFAERNKFVVPVLDAAAREKGELLTEVQRTLADRDHTYSVGIDTALYELQQILKLPVATSLNEDLNKGTGGLSAILKARIPSAPEVVVKIQKDRKYELTNFASDDAVYRSLEPLGGPKYYGKFRIRDANGNWRPGVAMEKIPGKDLLTLEFERRGGAEPSLRLTDKHLKAFEEFIARVTRERIRLDDIQPGDFLLTPDGRLVPVDMKATKLKPEEDQKGFEGTLTTLKEKYELLRKVYAYQQGRP